MFWGKRLGECNDLLPGSGMQNAITPPAQTIRNYLMFASLLALPIVGVYELGWAIGLGGLLATVVLSGFIGVAMPKTDSSFFFATILRSLVNRRAKFARASDEIRVDAIDMLLERLNDEFITYQEEHHLRP